MLADDLVAWLVALVGDACRRKLAGTVLGNEQERALARVADWAIRATASELAPGTGKDTASLARDIGQMFNPPDLGELASAGGTLLEAISAGITGRVAVPGDRDITGTGLSYSEITGIGWQEIADGLRAHLIRKIIAAGTGGGPLKPLADQLNHDATHIQNAAAASAMSAGFAAVLAEMASMRGLVIGPGQPTAAEFAEDLRGMLEGPCLAGRAWAAAAITERPG